MRAPLPVAHSAAHLLIPFLLSHLDHCGALPFFTELCGYDGPIYATHPTRAIAPILLEDFRKLAVERRGEAASTFFTSQHIRDCMSKVVPLHVKQRVMVDDELEVAFLFLSLSFSLSLTIELSSLPTTLGMSLVQPCLRFALALSLLCTRAIST